MNWAPDPLIRTRFRSTPVTRHPVAFVREEEGNARRRPPPSPCLIQTHLSSGVNQSDTASGFREMGSEEPNLEEFFVEKKRARNPLVPVGNYPIFPLQLLLLQFLRILCFFPFDFRLRDVVDVLKSDFLGVLFMFFFFLSFSVQLRSSLPIRRCPAPSIK